MVVLTHVHVGASNLIVFLKSAPDTECCSQADIFLSTLLFFLKLILALYVKKSFQIYWISKIHLHIDFYVLSVYLVTL